MLKSVYVYSNQDKDPSGEKRKYVEDFLLSQNVEVKTLTEKSSEPYQADLAVVLGGDGTMIRLAHHCLEPEFQSLASTWEDWVIWQRSNGIR